MHDTNKKERKLIDFLPGYSAEALRTLAPGDDLKTNVSTDMLHAVLGLVDESGELAGALRNAAFDLEASSTRTPVLEELGDLFWFLSLAFHAVGTSGGLASVYRFSEIVERHPRSWTRARGVASAELRDDIADLAGYVKKAVYGARLDVGMIEHKLLVIFTDVCQVCYGFGIHPKEVQEANLRKLAARYPAGALTTQEALDRDTARETAAMEGKDA